MKLNQKQSSIFKGITSEGPNKLNRKGKPLKFKKHRRRNVNSLKKSKKLSIKNNSKLRNQLASLRQSTRPIANKNAIRYKKQKKKKNSGLVQALQFNKLKSSKLSFGTLTKRSLLFSVEQITKMDKITIYYIGKSGLLQLSQLNDRFERYKETLFDEKQVLFGGSAKNKFFSFDRSSNNYNSKENEFIDNEIVSLLRDLTDYFLLEEAHKVLEFLIAFYKIHLNHPLSALECCFPYYSSTTFVRFIQLIEFNHHKWQLLFLNVQKNLTPLNKEILIKQCCSDNSILQFIQQMHYKHNVKSEIVKQFYTDIMINILNKSKSCNQNLLLQIIPCITSNLHSSSSAHIILNFIASKVKLNESQTDEIIKALLRKNVNERSLLSLDHIIKSQNIRKLKSAIIDLLLYRDDDYHIMDLFIKLNEKFNISLPFIITKQLITSSSKNNKMFLEQLLTRFDFQKTHKMILCDMICENAYDKRDLLDILKNNVCFDESLNESLWKNKERIVKNPHLLNYLLSSNKLKYVLKSSLIYENDAIAIGVMDKIEFELKQKRMTSCQVIDLLNIIFATNTKLKITRKVIDILFKHKLQLINKNVLLLLLKSNLKSLSLQLNATDICRLFELLCFGLKIINDDDLITLINCWIIDILSNASQQSISSLLNILSQYHSPNILIHSVPSKDCNISNLFEKMGQNMVLKWKQFMQIIPYLSIQSKCLLLLCIKEMTQNNDKHQLKLEMHKMISILVKISSDFNKQNEEFTNLIMSIFYLCITNIKLNNDENRMWIMSLIENEDKKQSKLLQILFNINEDGENIKLLLKILKCAKKTKTKAKCLYLLSVFLAKKQYKNTNEKELCSIVACLLFYLNKENKLIRFGAVQCFKNIDIENMNKSIIMQLVCKITQFEIDIIEDSQTLSRMFCNSEVHFSVAIMKTFVDYKHINYDSVQLFVAILFNCYNNNAKDYFLSNKLSINEISHDICHYLSENKNNEHWSRSVIEICKLNTLNCVEFEYIYKWIKEDDIIAILPLLTPRYWMQLTFNQQKQMYLSLETLLAKAKAAESQIIAEFILIVPLTKQMIEYWFFNNFNSMMIMMTRMQFIISKINKQSINKQMIKNTLMPSIMTLLKDIHLKMQNENSSKQQLQSLNWMRNIVLTALILMIDSVGDKIECNNIDSNILLKCMQYEWLFANHLFIQLICVLGKYLPQLLLKMYVPFIGFMKNNIKKRKTAAADVVFISLLSEFFESTIRSIAPFLKLNELKDIICASISLFDELCDCDLELQFISKLLKSFVSAKHESAVFIAYNIILCNKDSNDNDTNDMSRILFNASNHCIYSQLRIILNILSTSTALNRKHFLNFIAHHLNHSIFIKEFSLIVLENNDEIPLNINKLNSKIFKRLFDLLCDNNNTNILIYKCLNAVRGLLSLNSFALIIKQLINTKDKKKKVKSIELLLDQIQDKSERFKLNQVRYYLTQLIIPLYDELDVIDDNAMEQNIICILELTVKKFDVYSVVNEWLITVVPSLISRLEESINTNGNKIIIAHLMLLLSSAMRNIKKSLFLNHFSKILNITLKNILCENDELLIIASVFCLECIVSEYNDYIGAYLADILSCILSEKYLQLNLKLCHKSTMNNIASFDSVKLIKCLRNTLNSNAISLEAYFNIITLMIIRWKTRQQTLQCYHHLFELFKYCMDDEVIMDKFEFIILKCFSDLVLKLTDKEMMEIMEELIFWVDEFEINSVRYSIRTLSLFKFLCHCLHRFKSAFCGIAMFSYNLAVKYLTIYTNQEPPAKKQKIDENQSTKLLRRRRCSNYILQTIQLTLRYGKNEQLIDKTTFLMLLPVIVDEIRSGMKYRDEIMYIAYFEKYITPTLVCLANTTKDINLWNELNKRILSLCGHQKNIVRSAAVDALLALFSIMGHSWLNCLPQTLHSINELLQDDDDDVLQRTKSLIQTIELLTQSKLTHLT